MIGVSNHLLSMVFRFHYHSQKVIGSLGYRYIPWSHPQTSSFLGGQKTTQIFGGTEKKDIIFPSVLGFFQGIWYVDFFCVLPSCWLFQHVDGVFFPPHKTGWDIIPCIFQAQLQDSQAQLPRFPRPTPRFLHPLSAPVSCGGGNTSIVGKRVPWLFKIARVRWQ